MDRSSQTYSLRSPCIRYLSHQHQASDMRILYYSYVEILVAINNTVQLLDTARAFFIVLC